jgi:hypothetical protein
MCITPHLISKHLNPLLVYNMSGAVEQRGGSIATVVTFTVENLLYTAIITSICWFASHYFNIVRIPVVVFMFVDIVSVLAALHTVLMLIIFSMRQKKVGGAFSDCILSDMSQGFAVISSLLWLGLLLSVFIDVPRITSVPGLPSSASAVSLAIVLGFSIIIPFLAIVVTYAAVPTGGSNSLLFNGSTLGALSLIFFVLVSFGSGGVMKCAPYDGVGTSMVFSVLAVTYWVLLYLIELAVFFRFNPLTMLWNLLTGRGEQSRQLSGGPDQFPDTFSVIYWRIPGCVLNMGIIISTTAFCQSALRGSVIVVVVAVAIAHIPLIFSINFEWLLSNSVSRVVDIAGAVPSNDTNMYQPIADVNDHRMYNMNTPQDYGNAPIVYAAEGGMNNMNSPIFPGPNMPRNNMHAVLKQRQL